MARFLSLEDMTMPATPDENDVPDLFTDSAGQSDEEILASSRLQVGLVVSTGVLVIIITTLVVVLMGHNGQPLADGPNRPVGITSELPVPTPAPVVPLAPPSQTPDPTRSVTQTPGQTKKPTTAPPTTGGPVIATLISLSCNPSSVKEGETSICEITLSAPAHANLSISMTSGDTDYFANGSAFIAAGSTSATFSATALRPPPILLSATVSITATLSGDSESSTVTVTW